MSFVSILTLQRFIPSIHVPSFVSESRIFSKALMTEAISDVASTCYFFVVVKKLWSCMMEKKNNHYLFSSTRQLRIIFRSSETRSMMFAAARFRSWMFLKTSQNYISFSTISPLVLSLVNLNRVYSKEPRIHPNSIVSHPPALIASRSKSRDVSSTRTATSVRSCSRSVQRIHLELNSGRKSRTRFGFGH